MLSIQALLVEETKQLGLIALQKSAGSPASIHHSLSLGRLPWAVIIIIAIILVEAFLRISISNLLTLLSRIIGCSNWTNLVVSHAKRMAQVCRDLLRDQDTA